MGRGLRLRHRAAARRRRVHLRRGDGAVQLARGQARRAAEQAAVPGAARPLRQADRDQQRRDADQRAGDPADRRRRVRRRSAPRAPPARGCSACQRHRGAPRPVRGRSSAPRCARSSTSRAGSTGDAQGDPAGRRGRRVRHARRPGHPAHVRGRARGRLHAGLRRRDGVQRSTWTWSTSCCGSRGSSATSPAGSACRAAWARCARRRRCSGWSQRRTIGSPRGRARAARRHRPRDARRLDLRPRPDRGSAVQSAVATAPSVRRRRTRAHERRSRCDPPRRLLDVEIDGADRARRRRASTILDACRAQGVDTPTLCFADNLTPVNACRVCVVEVEGARTLVPACSRAAEDGMKVTTDTERVQHSRRLVMEFLASSVEMDLASADVHRWMDEYEVAPRAVRRADGRAPGGGARRARAGPPPRRPRTRRWPRASPSR